MILSFYWNSFIHGGSFRNKISHIDPIFLVKRVNGGKDSSNNFAQHFMLVIENKIFPSVCLHDIYKSEESYNKL